MSISSYLHEKEGQIYKISDIARSKRELTIKFSTIFPLLSMAICYIIIYAGSHSYQLLAALSYPIILEQDPINKKTMQMVKLKGTSGDGLVYID